MACKCATPTDEYHGWECSVSGGACMFLRPDSKRCAEEYGEGPDAYSDSESDNDQIIEDTLTEESDEFESEEDEIDRIADGDTNF